MGDEKAVTELAAEIAKIDFNGGLAPADSTPAIPEQKPTEETPSTPVTPAKSDVSEKETPVVSETPAEESAEEAVESTPAKAEEKSADDKPAIPDSHYRAALHMGWKAEDVAELYDANPDLALKTLSKCYEQVNAASKQLGELGQRARQLREAPTAPAPVVPSRKEAVKKMLKDEYEDSKALEALVDLIPEQVQPTRPQQPQAEPVQDRQVEIEREVAVRQQINTFFGADEMGVYSDFYGKVGQTGAWDTLTPGQRANRVEVCNRAQLILDGAAMTGMQMSAAEALERAHLEVAAPMAEQFVRERIVKSVQKRAAGVTLKPSGSKTPAPAAGAYDEKQAVVDVAAEIKKLGLGAP